MKTERKTSGREVEPDVLIGLEGTRAAPDEKAGRTLLGEPGAEGQLRLGEDASPYLRRETSPAGTPGSIGAKTKRAREDVFAVLHVADFGLQAVVRLERDLAGRAVALLDESRRPAVVTACTAGARAAGVENGQTAAQAMARCAEVVLRTVQLAAESEARAGLWAAAWAVSPQVEDTAPGVCTLQVGGVFAERREAALHAAVAQLAELGLTATAGLAATPLLALYAARFGAEDGNLLAGNFVLGTPFIACEPAPASDGPALARRVEMGEGECRAGSPDPAVVGRGERTVGSGDPALQRAPRAWSVAEDGGEPSGYEFVRDASALAARCLTLRRGEERAFLANLPLAVAEPPVEVAEILAGWGVRTLGQLTALTKADITLRLGPGGLALWERAAGEVTRPLRLLSPPAVFAAEMRFEHEIETLEPLLFVLRRFIDRLALELRTAGFVAGEMVLGLELTDETVYTREFRLPEPTAQEEILFRVLHTHLESLHLAATVGGVTLECRPVRPLVRQQGLFESALRDPHGFAETLGRLAAVVGPERVGTPGLENTHRPDAVTLAKPAAVVPPAEKPERHSRQGPPLRRYRPPLGATVELQGVAPAFVWTTVVRGAVVAVEGPWRGSGEWWDAERRWRREEWDVELESGGVYRLLHTPEGWFVEGEYD